MAAENMRTSVWITGTGAVSSAGENVRGTRDAFWNARRHPAAALPFECSISCPTFQVAASLPVLEGRRNHSRSLRLAMLAAREALTEAGLDPFAAATRVGVCLGTTVACQLNAVAFYNAYRRKTTPALDPVLDFLSTNLAGAVGDLLGAVGPRMTVVNACSSGTDAIGIASDWIRGGLCDVALAGGADELHRVPLAGFWSLGVMSAEPCAPFDRHRAGLNLGEGAGIVVLESRTHATRRGKAPDFEIAGFGAACDAHHLTAPHPEGRGLERAIRTALAEADVAASQIAFINAHGTATLDNDRVEAGVIARVFGTQTPFLSTKGYTGHTLGAAGGLEAIFTVLGLREGWVPACAGFVHQADDIPLTPTCQRTPITGDCALSTSLAFGGNNAAVVIRRVA
jgi:3-oxoacyl-(acyl-carrier-protein) synthase